LVCEMADAETGCERQVYKAVPLGVPEG